MKHYELLRMCADRLERSLDQPIMHDIILFHPHGRGRFPFIGGGTEKLNETAAGSAYAVSIHYILSKLSRALKDMK